MIPNANIPHFSSRAVEFTASVSAPMVGGFYTFNASQWVPLATLVPQRRGIYVVRGLSFAADVDEGNYTANIVELPRIWFGLTANIQSSIFRFPIPLSVYRRGVEWDEVIVVDKEPCQMLARAQGRLSQSAALVGKADITLFVTLTTYEITDDAWIAEYKKGYKK